MPLEQLVAASGGPALKKIEAFIRHEVGDGKIFGMPVDEAIRIRTGEGGEGVLQVHTEEEVAARTQAE